MEISYQKKKYARGSIEIHGIVGTPKEEHVHVYVQYMQNILWAIISQMCNFPN